MPPKQKPGRSKQDYPTPPEFLIAACRHLEIPVFAFDLAATRGENNVVPECFTKADDALARPWPMDGWNWLNPEFADIVPWVEKAYLEAYDRGVSTAVLIPASVGANWWVDWVEDKAAIVPLQGRIKFVGHTAGYPKDCALLIYSPNWRPGWRSALKWMDLLTDEEKDMAKKRTAKPKKKAAVKVTRGKFAATTKAGKKAEQIAAARATKAKKANGKVTHEGGTGERFPSRRVTVITPNGSSSRDPLPEPTPLDLGPILLPDPDDAVRVLKELATLNDQAQQAKKVYEDLKDRTKTAKEKYDDLADMVLTRLRVTTHKSDLPLFDERTEDQTRMETAGKLVVAAPAEPLGDDLPADEELIPPMEVVATEALNDLADPPF